MLWKTNLGTAIAALLIATSTTTGAAWGMNRSFALAMSGRPRDRQSLHEAAACDNATRVLDLLSMDVSVNQRDVVGKTAFDYAVKYGRLRIVKILLHADPF
ncbi:MAG: ankyrin repeat domain-containing protein, partial [Myxococcota bacterium]